MVGLSGYSIECFRADDASDWGGGGKTRRCVLLPRTGIKSIHVPLPGEASVPSTGTGMNP